MNDRVSSGGEKGGEERLNELASRLRSVEAKPTDEVSKLIAENWMRVVFAMLIAGLFVWLWNEVRTSQEKALGEAAQRFSTSQEAFLALLQAPPDDKTKLEERRKAIQDTLDSIRNNYGKTVYAPLAVIYEAAIDLSLGKNSEALALLQSAKLDGPVLSAPAKLDEDAFVKELGAFLVARASLQENAGEGRRRLEELFRNGTFSNAGALSVLLGLSSPDERQVLVSTAKQVAASKPELRKPFNSVLAPFGYSIES